MRILTTILLFFPLLLLAQDPPPPSDLSGAELREWLRDNWYLPWHNDLGYGPAREAMFGTIDNEGGTLECVYSGFTQPAEEVTFPDPINTEHTVPQSFFNSQTPMRSDIHHLFPTHMQANGTRGSLPYGEVVDNQADEWLIGSAGSYNESSSIPGSNIDAYSEIEHNVYFEPREEQKGNTARAIFYFYTMYADDVEAAFSDISSMGDLNTLYEWHVMDPPDTEEVERNEEIQAAQGNYNPYISMPELAGTAWGFTSSLTESESVCRAEIQGDMLRLPDCMDAQSIAIFDITGRLVYRSISSQPFHLESLDQGLHIITVYSQRGTSVLRYFR
ncbi:MAG: hypothetical protein HKN79_05135 [Flavobacteriales bacterium]|nr:hypothetical protein [Flavobacteriales bacterium]